MDTFTIPWDDDLVDESTAAQIKGVTPTALWDKRKRGTAPPNARCPCGCKRVLYSRKQLEQPA